MKMWSIALLTAALAAFGGPALAEECKPATSAQIEKIRTDMETKLLDAQSARFSDVCVKQGKRETGGKDVYCGKVNAKNKLGAYVGYRAFSYFGPGTANIPSMEDKKGTDMGRLTYCFACLGTYDFCQKQKWIHNPKLLSN